MTSWKLLIVFALATIVVISAGPINKCVLQENTAVKQLELSALDRLHGELLTTESNGNIYFVSICHSILQTSYDPRKLSGVIKITPERYSIDLGHIDQANVIVNENTIVLTYVGGDKDKDPRDKCKGLRWTSYLTFVCDPFSTSDVLTLTNEDTDQPEICQVWFEIKTSKTCQPFPNLRSGNLENEFSSQHKLVNKVTERKIIDSNHIPYGNKSPTAVEYNKFNVSENSSDIVIQDNNLYRVNKEKNTFKDNMSNIKINYEKEFTNNEIENNNLNKNYSQNTNIEKKLFIANAISILMNKHKSINNNNDERNLNKYIISEEKLPYNQNNNFSFYQKYPNRKIEKTVDIHKIKSQNDNIKDKFSINQYFRDENTFMNEVENNYILNKNDLQNSTSNNEINNFGKENKPMNEEDIKNGNTTQENSTVQSLEYKKLLVNETDSKLNDVYNNESSNYKVSNSDNKNETLNGEKNTISNKNDLQNNTSNNEINNFDKENKPMNEGDIKNGNTTQENSTVQSFENKKSLINENNFNQNNISTNKLSSDTNLNSGKENKTINNENENTEKSANINSEDKLTRSKIDNSDKENTSTSENKNSDINQNTSESNSSNNENNYLMENSTVNNKSEENNLNKNATLNNNTEYNTINNTNDNLANNNSIITKNKNATLNQNISQEILPKTEKSNSSINENSLENDNKSNKTDLQSYNLKNLDTEDKSTNEEINSSTSNKTISKEKISNNEEINSIKNVKSAGNETKGNNSMTNENSSKENNISLNNVNKSNNVLSNGTQYESDKEKPTTSEDIISKKNDTSIESGATNQNEKYSKINSYNSTIDSNSTTVEDITPTKNTIFNDSTSKETQQMVTNKPTEGLINNNNTTDKSEFNSTSINQINNAEKNVQTDQSKTSNQNTANTDKSSNLFNNSSGIGKTDNTSQSEDDSDSGGFFAKLFPNGIKFNATTILVILGSLSGVSVLVGTAVNRYYYKLSGTDQIPFKETFQTIYTNLKGLITKMCCCCGFLEVLDTTNEKTPLLQPQNSIKSIVQDNTSQKHDSSSDEKTKQKGKAFGNDNTNEHGYGSTSNESHSIASDEVYSKSKTENNLQKKSVSEVVDGKMNTIFNTNVIPNIENIFKKVGEGIEKPVKEEKNENIVKNGNLENTLTDKLEKSVKIPYNQSEVQKPQDTIKNEEKNKLINESQLIDSKSFQDVKTNGDTNSKIVLPDIQQSLDNIIKNIDEELISRSVNSELLNSKQNKTNNLLNANKSGEIKSVDTIDEINKTKESAIEQKQKLPIVDGIKTKINESKLKFLGLLDKKDEEKEVLNASNISENQVKDKDDDSIEVIEEIIYVDDADGLEEGDEIIEEIIETTTVEDSPETGENSETSQSSDANKEHHTTVTTVRKTSIRKLSTPGEVITKEETIVNDGKSENEKKQFGIQFGIGKSGVNMSVGDKNLGIGRSGLKFGKKEGDNENKAMTIKLDKSGLKLNRNKNKMSKTSDGEELDVDESEERDSISPEVKKSKSIPNFKIFKRSISQPTESDIQEVEEGFPKKVPRNASNLLKFGKSRSKSTSVLTTDVNVLSSFIDHERYASEVDLDKSEKNDEKIVERKVSMSSPLLSSSEIGLSSTDLKIKKDGQQNLIPDKYTAISSDVYLSAGASAGNLEVENNENQISTKSINKKSKSKRGKKR